MRKLIGIFAILALVVTTTVPVTSHAMPRDGVKTAQTETSKGHDCHHHGAKVTSEKTEKTEKAVSEKCCDKGICKCVGGTCHNGLSKIFGNDNPLPVLSSDKNHINVANEFVDSIQPEGLKRPPRT